MCVCVCVGGGGMLKEGEVLRDTVGSRVTEYWNRGVCYRRQVVQLLLGQ